MSISAILIHPYTVVILRWILAAVLLTAGISKLRDCAGFAQAIGAYKILPAHLSRFYAFTLPWVEVLLGFSFLVGLWVQAASWLTIFLLSSFIVAISINLWRGNYLDCHCFGNLEHVKISTNILLRNVIFICFAAVILYYYNGYLSVEGWIFGWPRSTSLSPYGLIPVVLASVLFGIAIALIKQTSRIFTSETFVSKNSNE